MSGRKRDLLRQTADAWSREAALESEIDRRATDPPRPGDVFLPRETLEEGIEWVVLERAGDDEASFLIVPADTVPLIGSADVAIPAESPSGPLSVRCGLAQWVPGSVLRARDRTGILSADQLSRLRARWRQIEAHSAPATVGEPGVDGDPELEEWREVVGAARASLTQQAASPVAPPATRLAVPWWRSLARPAGLAASTLLVLALGLAAGLSLERRRAADLAAELVHAEVAPPPLVNLPVAWLSGDRVRDSTTAVTVAPGAGRLLLILRIPAGEPEGAEYRLEIHRPAGDVVWSSDRLRDVGFSEITLVLPPGLLAAGAYRLLLFRRDDGGSQVSRYTLNVAPE